MISIYLLFLLTMVVTTIGLMRIEGPWAECFLAFGISFAHAYDYSRRYIEKKSIRDSVTIFPAKVGLLAGLLGIIVFSLGGDFFLYYRKEEEPFVFYVLLFLGYATFWVVGVLAFFLASLFIEYKKTAYNIERKEKTPMITKIIYSLFLMTMMGIAVGVVFWPNIGAWVWYCSSFGMSFVGAHEYWQRHVEKNPYKLNSNWVSTPSAKVGLLAGLLGITVGYGIYGILFYGTSYGSHITTNSYYSIFFGIFVSFCVSLFKDDRKVCPTEKEGKSIADDKNNNILFFLSFSGVLCVVLFYALFVLFQETVPSEEFYDQLILTDADFSFETEAAKYNFFSYFFENHFRHLPWLLVIILGISSVFTVWQKQGALVLPMRRVLGLVLSVGNIVVIFNFPVVLIVGWFPYSLFLGIALLAVSYIEVKILRSK